MYEDIERKDHDRDLSQSRILAIKLAGLIGNPLSIVPHYEKRGDTLPRGYYLYIHEGADSRRLLGEHGPVKISYLRRWLDWAVIVNEAIQKP